MAQDAGIRAPNLPLGTSLSEFLGIETVGSQKSVKRFTRASVIGGIEAVANSFTVGGGIIFTTLSQAIANLNYDANKMAWVIQDPTPANNGVYQKTGASGSGSWSRLGDLPYSFYRAANEGAGTPNAIQATNGYPMASEDALIVVNITDTNTATPVTLSLNGATPLTIKTAAGNDIAVGGLVAGMMVAGYIDAGGTQFRLLSDQASAAIQAAAETAAATAVTARDLAIQAADTASTVGAGDMPMYPSRTIAEALSIPSARTYLVSNGFASQTDTPLHQYVKLGSTPSPVKAWHFNSTDGAYWELRARRIDPLVLGAVADGDGDGGGTDNATALQAALDYAGLFNCNVRLSPGVYRCDSALTVPAHVNIVGYGVTIDFKTAGNVMGILFKDGGSLRGVKIVGAGNSAMSSAGIAIACYGVNNTPAAPTFVAGPVIRDCVIDGWAGYGVIFNYTNRGLVADCMITNIGYAACMGLSANYMTVDNNLIDGVTPGTGDAYGIAFTRQSGATEIVDPRSYRCKAINNTIRNVFSVSGNNAQGMNTHAGVECLFDGNTIDHCEVGCIVAGASIGGSFVLGPKRCIVSNNVFVSTDTPVGVGTMVSGAINGSSVDDFAEGCVVTGNTYLGFGIPTNGISGALIIQGSKGTIVQGNALRSPRCNGIRVGLSNVGFNISGNTIIDPHDTTYTVPACVYVSDNTNRGYIGGNTFYYENSGLNTYVAIQSIRIESGREGLAIEMGRCSFIGIDSGHLSYIENTSTGVNAAGLMVQRGRATVSLTDAASGSQEVTTQRFPSAPRVALQVVGTPKPGTVAKPALVEVADTIVKTAFSIVARPYDASSFGGSGTLIVDWVATT